MWVLIIASFLASGEIKQERMGYFETKEQCETAATSYRWNHAILCTKSKAKAAPPSGEQKGAK